MSSETKIDGPHFGDRLAIGVAIMAIRLTSAAAVGMSLAVLLPAYGLAQEPEIMKQVETQIQIDEATVSEEDKKGLLSIGWEKTKAGAGGLWDKALKIDEREERLIADNDRLRKELVAAKAEAVEARYQVGVKHDMMVQCGVELLDYLKALPDH